MMSVEIANRFSGSAKAYREQAHLQNAVADAFLQWLSTGLNTPKQSPQTVIELGCGTGFLTKRLRQHLPKARLIACDLSAGMLRECEEQTGSSVDLHLADAATFDPAVQRDWTLSSFCLQWVGDLSTALRFHAERSQRLSICLPCAGSFSDWTSRHSAFGVTASLWPLPASESTIATLNDIAHQLGAHLRWQRMWQDETHDSPMHFAQHLRRIGADCSQSRTPGLSLRRVIRALPSPYTATYEVLMADLTR